MPNRAWPAKRTKYLVRVQNETARFSNVHHAQLFAALISKDLPEYLIEVQANDCLMGQYQNGTPTPEFEPHHISGPWHHYADTQ